jgi:hypothetical protein
MVSDSLSVSYINKMSEPRVCLLLSLSPWPLVRERTIPTERPPLVDEI